MSKKFVLVSLVFLAGLPVAGEDYNGWDHLFPSAPGANRRNFARIAVGMGEQQVLAIMGGTPKVERMSTGGIEMTSQNWWGDDYAINVEFINGEAVTGRCHRLDGSEADCCLSADPVNDSVGTILGRWLCLAYPDDRVFFEYESVSVGIRYRFTSDEINRLWVFQTR